MPHGPATPSRKNRNVEATPVAKGSAKPPVAHHAPDVPAGQSSSGSGKSVDHAALERSFMQDTVGGEQSGAKGNRSGPSEAVHKGGNQSGV